MNKKALLFIIILVLALGFTAYKFFLGKNTDVSGIKIVTNPPTNIFLNNKLTGKTPFEDKFPPGEYVLKLIPENTATQASFWQGKVKLNPDTLTYISRDLGPSELTSAGEVLLLEKIPQNEAQLSVISQPDAAIVLFDGQERGVTPLFLTDLSPGEHDIALSSPGFAARSLRAQLSAGYKLMINFQLALLKNEESSISGITPTPDRLNEKGKPNVIIKDTETGFLRVRNNPSKSAEEIAQVKPGDKFNLIEEKEGWYKISFGDDKEGWISSRYAEKKE